MALKPRPAIWSLHPRQKFGQVLFEPLCAAANRRNVDVAATGASARYPFRETAMVATQCAVNFVEDAVGTAVRAFAFPAAVMAGQHWGVAAPV